MLAAVIVAMNLFLAGLVVMLLVIALMPARQWRWEDVDEPGVGGDSQGALLPARLPDTVTR